MFLGQADIWKRLSAGDLVVDPNPDSEQVGGFTIDLHLGTQLAVFPTSRVPVDVADLSNIAPSQDWLESRTMPVGSELVVFPGTSLIAVTLQYVHLPPDLAGFFFPNALSARMGLSISAGTVDPGFRGKLAIAARNVGTMPIALTPGLRIVRLCLGQLSSSPDPDHINRRLSAPIETAFPSAPRPAPPKTPGNEVTHSWSKRLTEMTAATGTKKGKALEELISEVFSSVQGLRVVKRNARLRAEEIDLLVRNDLATGFWRLAGSPLVVECKNWAGRVGAREIALLLDKMRSLGPDSRTGVLVALSGVTGNFQRDAILKIREARQAGLFVVVIDRQDLNGLVAGEPLEEILERKYESLLLI